MDPVGKNFRARVIEAVKRVPRGRVVSYGQIAAFLGSPRAARQVGWALHTLDGAGSIPWWRVVNAGGKISIKGNLYSTASLQRGLLIKEGVQVNEDLSLDIARYRYELR